MPRFSVIVACYNAAETLPETLASLQAQTETNWEAICVDDGSTDASLKILRSAAEADPRIRVITQQNEGPSRARNTGAVLARADWIAFLDADDLWVPEKLAQVTEAADAAPETSAIFGKVAFFDPDTGKTTAFSNVTPGVVGLDQLLGENPVCTLSNLCVRRLAFLELGGLREDMRYSEDLEFLIRFAADGKMLTAMAELHTRYRASSGGLSANLLLMHEGWRQAIRSAGPSLSAQRRARAEALHLRYLARRALRLGAPPGSAVHLALTGFSLSPLTFLGGGYRGPATFIFCLISPFMPACLRRALFC